jgi:hypothetical protein
MFANAAETASPKVAIKAISFFINTSYKKSMSKTSVLRIDFLLFRNEMRNNSK